MFPWSLNLVAMGTFVSMAISWSISIFKSAVQGIIYLVSHSNLLCIFYMTAIQDIFCVAVFLHRSVQNLVWNICLLTEIANQIWRGKLFPAVIFAGWELRNLPLVAVLYLFWGSPLIRVNKTIKFDDRDKIILFFSSKYALPDETKICKKKKSL